MTLSTILLIATSTTTALITGLFYAYSCSVTPGLALLSDKEYLKAFQSINRAILNPVFAISFFGTALLLPITTFAHYNEPPSARFLFLLAATIVYFIGGLGITFLGNIPLNNQVERFDLKTATEESMADLRTKFERPWNRLNHLRTLSSILSMILITIACLYS